MRVENAEECRKRRPQSERIGVPERHFPADCADINKAKSFGYPS
jgi:hypothetical protein